MIDTKRDDLDSVESSESLNKFVFDMTHVMSFPREFH